MKTKRTPPSSPAPTVSTHTATHTVAPVPTRTAGPAIELAGPAIELLVPAQHLQHCSSEPSLYRKRKRSLSDDDKLNDFMKKMRTMFSNFKEDQDKRADKICAAVEDIRASLDFFGSKLELAQARIVELETAREADVQCFKALEDRLEALERGSRSTCLEIRNIPVAPSETKASLLDTFIKAGDVLKVPIQKSEVKDIFRIRSKDPASRTVIVDLCSTLQKEKNISMFRHHNKGSSRLTTEHLRISGPPKPIFISENLSSKMKRLFFLSRDYAKVNDFKFCWVSHGKIFLRKRERASDSGS